MVPVQHMKLLCIDKMRVDTSLAQEYLQKHAVFPLLGLEADDTDIVHDSYGSKIITVTIKETYKGMEKKYNFDQDQMKTLLKKVAKKVKDNSDLFAQLEYLIRKTNVEDVKTYDVPLIAKRFEYYATLRTKSTSTNGGVSYRLHSYHCLAALGRVAQYLYEGVSVRLACYPDVAVVTHLFTELCYDAGFTTEQVQYCTVKGLPYSFRFWRIQENNYLPGMVAGAVAVVTDKCDLESAASCLEGATVNPRYPWRLRRVLVLEPALAGLRRALARRAGAAEADNQYAFNDKTFLLDPTADEGDLAHRLVLVSAYRTTKELLALLDKYRPIYLSLWCNDSSTRDEIAFGTSAANVWVNDYGDFEGPAEVGRSYYAGFDYAREESRRCYYAGEQPVPADEAPRDYVQQILQLRAVWDKMDIEQRRAALLTALDRYKTELAANEIEECDRLHEVLLDWRPQPFAEVDKHTLCIGTTEKGCVVSLTMRCTPCTFGRLNILKSVLNGNAVMLTTDGKYDRVYDKKLLGHFHDNGVPVVEPTSSTVCDVARVADYSVTCFGPSDVDCLFRKKFIWSKFGETFAN